MLRLTAYKVAIGVLLAITVLSSGVATYLYQQQGVPISRASDLNNQIISLNSQIDSYKTQTNSLSSQISALNTQISSLNAQISQLQSSNSQLKDQIAALRLEVANLNAQIAILTSDLNALRASKVITALHYSITYPTLLTDGKGTLVNVAWANLGTIPANNALLTLNFYASPIGEGTPLCSVAQSLGTNPVGFVDGRSIDAYPSLTNSCSTGPATAQYARGTVTWS